MEILQTLEKAGVWFVIEDGRCRARYKGAMPDELQRLLQDNVEEVKAAVLDRERRLQEGVAEAVAQLQKQDKVKVYSQTLREYIFFCTDDGLQTIPKGAVAYTLSELKRLHNTNYEGWRQLHRAKKAFGGCVVAVKGGDEPWKWPRSEYQKQ